MLRIAIIIFAGILCAFIYYGCATIINYGCATIINGSTQDVQVIMPEGTQVSDVLGGDNGLAIHPP